MYTIPAKVTTQTKTLIDAFEKGQLTPISTDEEDQTQVKPHHPELYVDELAEPGTARKLLQAFEFRRQHSETYPSDFVKSPTTTGKLSVDRFLSFEAKSPLEKRSLVNGFLNGKVLEVEKENGAHVEVVKEVIEELSGDGTVGHVEEIHLEGTTNGSSDNHDQSVIISITNAETETPNEITDVHQVNADNNIKEEIDVKILEEIQEQPIVSDIKVEIESGLNKVNNNNSPEDIREDNVETKIEIQHVKEIVETNVEKIEENNVAINQTVTEHVIIVSCNGDLSLNDVAEVKVGEEVAEKVEKRIVEEVVEKIESKIEENVEDKIEGGPIDGCLSSTLEDASEISDNFANQTTSGQEINNVAASTAGTLDAENIDSEKTGESVKRTILIVSAVKPENNLDLALREASVRVLVDAGHDVIVTDVFNITTPAYNDERRRLLEADLIIFHYRPILNSPPALLKSWLEGTLIQENGSPVDKALLVGKKAVILLTSTDSVPDDQQIENLPFLSTIQDSILKAYSMDVIHPFTIFGVQPNLTENELTEHSEKWIERLTAVCNESR